MNGTEPLWWHQTITWTNVDLDITWRHWTTISEWQTSLLIVSHRWEQGSWGPSGANRTQVGPMLAPWTLLSGILRFTISRHHSSGGIEAACLALINIQWEQNICNIQNFPNERKWLWEGKPVVHVVPAPMHPSCKIGCYCSRMYVPFCANHTEGNLAK